MLFTTFWSEFFFYFRVFFYSLCVLFGLHVVKYGVLAETDGYAIQSRMNLAHASLLAALQKIENLLNAAFDLSYDTSVVGIHVCMLKVTQTVYTLAQRSDGREKSVAAKIEASVKINHPRCIRG